MLEKRLTILFGSSPECAEAGASRCRGARRPQPVSSCAHATRRPSTPPSWPCWPALAQWPWGPGSLWALGLGGLFLKYHRPRRRRRRGAGPLAAPKLPLQAYKKVCANGGRPHWRAHQAQGAHNARCCCPLRAHLFFRPAALFFLTHAPRAHSPCLATPAPNTGDCAPLPRDHDGRHEEGP